MKKKILCLHGYSMDDRWLAEWCQPFQAALGEQAELIIPRAPIVVPQPEVLSMAQRFGMSIPPQRMGEGKNWCWYRATDDKPPVYLHVEIALDFLADLFAEHGEIDGVLGWSQGTVMAALLAALHSNADDPRYSFKWAVLCGGFRPGDARFRSLFERPLAMPSLHVIGERESDFMQTQGQRLAESFVNAEIMRTPVGHILPIKYPDLMASIAAWMSRQCMA